MDSRTQVTVFGALAGLLLGVVAVSVSWPSQSSQPSVGNGPEAAPMGNATIQHPNYVPPATIYGSLVAACLRTEQVDLAVEQLKKLSPKDRELYLTAALNAVNTNEFFGSPSRPTTKPQADELKHIQQALVCVETLADSETKLRWIAFLAICRAAIRDAGGPELQVLLKKANSLPIYPMQPAAPPITLSDRITKEWSWITKIGIPAVWAALIPILSHFAMALADARAKSLASPATNGTKTDAGDYL